MEINLTNDEVETICSTWDEICEAWNEYLGAFADVIVESIFYKMSIVKAGGRNQRKRRLIKKKFTAALELCKNP